MARTHNPWRRLGEADAVDWAFAGLFFALGMLVAAVIHVMWG